MYASTEPPGPTTRSRLVGPVAHLMWEAVLLVLVVIAAVVVFTVTAVQLEALFWFNIAGLGLLATGFALSLRTATPNLAVGALAVLAGVVFARLVLAGWSTLAAGFLVAGLTLTVGLVLGLIGGLTSAPGWAVSLAGLAGAQAAALALSDAGGVVIGGGRAEASVGVLWTVVFVVVSVAGGAAFLVPKVRRRLGANRTDGDPVRWRPARLLGALVGFGGSSVLAGIGGVVLALSTGFVTPTGDFQRLLLAVGAAVLGGVSVFGRRGGVTGTVLGTVLMVLISLGLAATGAARWIVLATPAAAIVIGIGASRLLETIAGPEEPL